MIQGNKMKLENWVYRGDNGFSITGDFSSLLTGIIFSENNNDLALMLVDYFETKGIGLLYDSEASSVTFYFNDENEVKTFLQILTDDFIYEKMNIFLTNYFYITQKKSVKALCAQLLYELLNVKPFTQTLIELKIVLDGYILQTNKTEIYERMLKGE